MFLSPEGDNIETIADDFGTDVFILPISSGFCHVLSVENKNLNTEVLYEMFDRGRENKISQYVYMYDRTEESFKIIERN